MVPCKCDAEIEKKIVAEIAKNNIEISIRSQDFNLDFKDEKLPMRETVNAILPEFDTEIEKKQNRCGKIEKKNLSILMRSCQSATAEFRYNLVKHLILPSSLKPREVTSLQESRKILRN